MPSKCKFKQIVYIAYCTPIEFPTVDVFSLVGWGFDITVSGNRGDLTQSFGRTKRMLQDMTGKSKNKRVFSERKIFRATYYEGSLVDYNISYSLSVRAYVRSDK